jgi:hypothetical protein
MKNALQKLIQVSFILCLIVLTSDTDAQHTVTISKDATTPNKVVPIDGKIVLPYGAYYVFYSSDSKQKPVADCFEYEFVKTRTVKDAKTIWEKLAISDANGVEPPKYVAVLPLIRSEVTFVLSEAEDGEYYFCKRPSVFMQGEALKDIPAVNGYAADFDPSSSYADYRIVYNANLNYFYVQRRKKDAWTTLDRGFHLRDRLRMRVNDLIDIRIENYNALRDSFSVKYSFEDLNQENKEEFIALFGRLQPSEDEEKEEKEGSEEEEKEDVEKEPASVGIEALAEEVVKQDKSSPTQMGLTEEQVKQILTDEVLKGLIKDESVTLEAAKARLSTMTSDSLESGQMKGRNSAERQLFIKSIEDAVEKEEKKAEDEQAAAEEQEKKALKAVFTELDELLKTFETKLEESKKQEVTPDFAQLRIQLLEELNKKTALSKYLDLSKSTSASSQIDVAIQKAVKLKIEGVEEEKIKEKAKKLQTLFSQMTVYRMSLIAPIQMQDYDRLNMEFEKNGETINASPYRFYSVGGFAVNFSTGFGVSALTDRRFYYSETRTDSTAVTNIAGTDTTTTMVDGDTFGKIAGERGDLNYGLTALAHFYTRSGGKVNLSLTLGGLIQQDQVLWLGGGSLLLGQRQRLVLSGGVALGNVLRLKKGYEEGEFAKDSNATVNGDVNFTEDRVDHSWFFSATYNFGGSGGLTTRK